MHLLLFFPCGPLILSEMSCAQPIPPLVQLAAVPPFFFSRTLSVPLAKNISGAPCILVGAYFHRQHWLADANTSVIMVLTFGVLALFSRCRSCAGNPSPTFHTSYCQHFCAEPVSLIVSRTFVMLYTIVVCRAHKWCQPDTTPSSVFFVSNRQPRFFRFATILPH